MADPLCPLTPDLAQGLSARLPEGRIGAVPEAYLAEPRGRFHGRSAALARPGSTAEVAEIVRFCAEHRIGIVPYAGGTGLVGGQIDRAGAGLLLSVERLNKVHEVNADDNVMIAGAGVILAEAQDAADGAGRLFPLSLASEGSARLGGLLATNAGGVQVLRYGNARELCLGVEAVLADGSVLRGLKRLRKDNAGYDLRNLIVGSEGTLGIITAAALRLHPKPEEVSTALVAVASPAAALKLLNRMRDRLGETVNAFELIHRQGLDFLGEVLPDTPMPFGQAPAWSVLVEASGGRGAHIAPRLENALEAALEDGLALDAWIAQGGAQAASFWQIREKIPEANRLIGAIASHDISVPISSIPEFIDVCGAALAAFEPSLRINCFGHLGDGNLHYNAFPPKGGHKRDYQDRRAGITEIVHETTHGFGGSISAEHGVGRLKVADLERFGDAGKLSAMRAIKAALDPNGILNPGAVLSG